MRNSENWSRIRQTFLAFLIAINLGLVACDTTVPDPQGTPVPLSAVPQKLGDGIENALEKGKNAIPCDLSCSEPGKQVEYTARQTKEGLEGLTDWVVSGILGWLEPLNGSGPAFRGARQNYDKFKRE